MHDFHRSSYEVTHRARNVNGASLTARLHRLVKCIRAIFQQSNIIVRLTMNFWLYKWINFAKFGTLRVNIVAIRAKTDTVCMDICQEYSNNFDEKSSNVRKVHSSFLDDDKNNGTCTQRRYDLHCSFTVTHRQRNVNGTSLTVRLHRPVKCTRWDGSV